MGRRIVITGATGLVGQRLVSLLAIRGDELCIVSRNPMKAERLFGAKARAYVWDGSSTHGWGPLVAGAHAVVNLAGEPLAGGDWTPARREEILASRLRATRAVAEAIRVASPRPAMLVQASAVGYFGAGGDEERTESSPPGEGFLADVARRWEEASAEVEEEGVRRVLLRSGIVLGTRGGAFPQLARPFSLFAGAAPGGTQWCSWIHVEDEIRAILFLLDLEGAGGAYNLVAPYPARMVDLCRELGRAMHRPFWGKLPPSIVRAIAGEMADETVLASIRVSPQRLLMAGFEFHFPDTRAAMRDLVFRMRQEKGEHA